MEPKCSSGGPLEQELSELRAENKPGCCAILPIFECQAKKLYAAKVTELIIIDFAVLRNV